VFEGLDSIGYEKYLELFPFHIELGIDLVTYISELGGIKNKTIKGLYDSVDPRVEIPFKAELDDLIRLHYLITSRKVTTILEFGVGKSTKVFDHALGLNKELHGKFVATNLRRANPFECHSIDNSRKWLRSVQKQYKTSFIKFHYSKCETQKFNGRICTMYSKIPNVCPDFIYLDGPDQFSPIGEIRGISTRSIDRLPMSADLLAIEHFLLPGTLIVVGGRSANARFLKSNFQRNWEYQYLEEYDQHFFELKEPPLGKINKKQVEFSQLQPKKLN
jgi:hypothetical protein